MYSMREINNMDKREFVSTVGPVFEHSPWVADKAWSGHPFNSFEHMYQAMADEMYNADLSSQLDLLRAHPDLGTKLEMTEASIKEQQGAGLNTLSEDEYKVFSELNSAYVASYGFPFIMAVKGYNKDRILEKMKQRQTHTKKEEIETALAEVAKIAKFRLEAMIDTASTEENAT